MNEDSDFIKAFNRLIEPLHITDDISEDPFSVLFERRIEELGITQSRAEAMLGIEKKSLNSILNKEAKRVDIITIIKLAQFLNLPVDGFVKVYLQELPSEQIGDIEKAKKNNFIVQNFDLPQLHKKKFISSKTDYEAIEKRIVTFFGLNSIYDFAQETVTPAFSRTKRSSSDLMREFWVQSALSQFKLIENPNPYNREQLIDLIPKIRPYTKNIEKGLLTVVKALFSIGITVIYQESLPNISVRGATFVVDGKPCIVINDLHKRYPTLWFSLMHELHHVLYDFDEIQQVKYHLTGEPDLWLKEEKANDFAREYLFNKKRSKYIKPFINESVLVREYADKSQVHPSIIYNFHMYDSDKWVKFNKYIPDSGLAINNLNVSIWESESVKETTERLKKEIFNI
ncbi:Putative plasmid maintenance system antidote protein [Croceitalea dokdonensis DOKDO 023]|uniref:Putative plasmid maintenance system antidote protein n=1 Tax=Croceitalea dokdonensis DOKDO 023 TaxID=1300341 RepID=A0A0N8H4H9_9FLAO|nr:helix-turn-helix domain-containing protein [Croceitalea dokdonensis]KPM33420.1 Putative plasmid maintenance system antidote protein [Croceitalea dokdonensis DOKDO 023]